VGRLPSGQTGRISQAQCVWCTACACSNLAHLLRQRLQVLLGSSWCRWVVGDEGAAVSASVPFMHAFALHKAWSPRKVSRMLIQAGIEGVEPPVWAAGRTCCLGGGGGLVLVGPRRPFRLDVLSARSRAGCRALLALFCCAAADMSSPSPSVVLPPCRPSTPCPGLHHKVSRVHCQACSVCLCCRARRHVDLHSCML